MAKILLVEDNRGLARSIAYNLELEGYDVAVAHDGANALETARSAPPDLMLLDLMLPEVDGFEVLETLRDEGFDAPVLRLQVAWSSCAACGATAPPS
jgi:DNA-binding response OmpR family regulator